MALRARKTGTASRPPAASAIELAHFAQWSPSRTTTANVIVNTTPAVATSRAHAPANRS